MSQENRNLPGTSRAVPHLPRQAAPWPCLSSRAAQLLDPTEFAQQECPALDSPASLSSFSQASPWPLCLWLQVPSLRTKWKILLLILCLLHGESTHSQASETVADLTVGAQSQPGRSIAFSPGTQRQCTVDLGSGK